MARTPVRCIDAVGGLPPSTGAALAIRAQLDKEVCRGAWARVTIVQFRQLAVQTL